MRKKLQKFFSMMNGIFFLPMIFSIGNKCFGLFFFLSELTSFASILCEEWRTGSKKEGNSIAMIGLLIIGIVSWVVLYYMPLASEVNNLIKSYHLSLIILILGVFLKWHIEMFIDAMKN